MPAIRALIVEDHPLHAEKLELMLEKLDIEVCGMADNALDALTLFGACAPDLLLVDVQLSGSFTGIDFAERVRKNSLVPIIYTTSVREPNERSKAVSTRPEAYLYKPIQPDELAVAIELALSRSAALQPQAAETAASDADALHRALFVRVGNSLKKLLINEVVYIGVSAKNYCDIRTTNRTLSVKASLNELEKQLPSGTFVRVSRSCLLNLHFVVEINEKEQLIETGFEPVSLGTSYRQALYQRIQTL